MNSHRTIAYIPTEAYIQTAWVSKKRVPTLPHFSPHIEEEKRGEELMLFFGSRIEKRDKK